MAINFFLYARKSEESEERQILSIEAQITELKIYAEREKLNIKETFVEAMTAKKPGRPKFNEMLARIEKGEAEGIIAWHPDRLARNSVDGGRIIYLLDTGHIKALKSPTFWFENTPQGKFMLNIAFGQSKYFVDNLSENVKRGIRQKLRNGGWPHSAPVGYLNDINTKTVVVDPVQCPLVKKLFEAYATGKYNFLNLRNAANEWGLVSRQKNKKLPTSLMPRILGNPFYYGLISYNGETFEGKHEPLITRQLFEQVQSVMSQRGRNHEVRKHHFAYLGLAACSCGASITAERQKGHNYYRCTRKIKPCKEPYTREELLDKQIGEAIEKVSLPEEGYKVMLAKLEKDKKCSSQTLHQEKTGIQKRLHEAKVKLDRLLDLHLDGAISQHEYNCKKEALLNKKLQLEEQLRQLEEQGNVWLEPMSEFIKTAHQASQLAASENLAAKRDFAKKIGSNFCLSSRTLRFSYVFPWPLLKKSRPMTNWGG